MIGKLRQVAILWDQKTFQFWSDQSTMKRKNWEKKQHKIESLSEVIAPENLRNSLVKTILILFKAQKQNISPSLKISTTQIIQN